MSDVLGMQNEPELPETPGEQKVSYVSVMQCHNSAVSLLMCTMIGGRRN
ncbi:SapB/AmfS family lanthipeptide [Nigerium massiliense]|nr:SapB/AmfS family lanthipeptide [Nigerium massiliense]